MARKVTCSTSAGRSCSSATTATPASIGFPRGIVWLSRCRISSYPGNYSSFVQQRELQELTQQRQVRRASRRTSRSRRSSSAGLGAGQRSKEAKGREKRLDRLLKSDQVIERLDVQEENPPVASAPTSGPGTRSSAFAGLSKSYGDKPASGKTSSSTSSAAVSALGIIGPNRLRQDHASRNVARPPLTPTPGVTSAGGANLNIGYYDQKLDDLRPRLDGNRGSRRRPRRARPGHPRRAGHDALPRRPTSTSASASSAAASAPRLRLAQLLLDKPNVLVLDEPTNHLDIAIPRGAGCGRSASFPGTILCVSHDRYFLDKSIQRLLVLDPPGLTDFGGQTTAPG